MPQHDAGVRRIDAIATVISPNRVVSPISGRAAAFVHVEVVERLGDLEIDEHLGAVIFGDIVRVELPDHARIDVVVRRAELRFALGREPAVPLVDAVAELVPMLQRARRGGVLCHREHLVLEGSRLRLRAVVETGAYSPEAGALVLRDDLAPVVLEDLLDEGGS